LVHASVKRKLVIGAAVLAVAAFAGGAYAATQEPAVSPRQAFINDVAKRLKVTPQQLTSAVRSAFLDELNSAVASKRLTTAQAGMLRQRLQRTGSVPLAGLLGLGGFGVFAGPPVAIPFKGNGRRFGPQAPVPGTAPGPLGGGPMPGRPRAFAVPFWGAVGPGPLGALGAIGRYLGTTPAKLLSQLRSGNSLAQMATADGKSLSGLEAALAAQRKALLDRLLKAGQITQAQETKLLARSEKRFSKLVSRRHPVAALLGARMRFAPRRGGWPAP
jgi:hypothetical protein